MTSLRDAHRVKHLLKGLLRDTVTMLGPGWNDQSDTGTGRDYPMRVACRSDRRGALVIEWQMASQPIVSRLLNILAEPRKKTVPDHARLKLFDQRIRARNTQNGW
ncbi:transposase, partial [Halorhodospira sp. 9621]